MESNEMLLWVVLASLPDTGPATLNALIDDPAGISAILPTLPSRQSTLSQEARNRLGEFLRDQHKSPMALKARRDLDSLLACEGKYFRSHCGIFVI